MDLETFSTAIAQHIFFFDKDFKRYHLALCADEPRVITLKIQSPHLFVPYLYSRLNRMGAWRSFETEKENFLEILPVIIQENSVSLNIVFAFTLLLKSMSHVIPVLLRISKKGGVITLSDPS